MFTIQVSACFPLPTQCCGKYCGITTDNCFFYLTLPACCEIHKYDKCLSLEQKIHVCRGYCVICYDRWCDCFWAVSASENNVIYKLNNCFEEIDCIHLYDNQGCRLSITGLSCCEHKEKLIITHSGGIGEVYKKGKCELNVLCCGGCYRGITCCEGYLVVGEVKNQQCCVSILEDCKNIRVQCCLPCEYCIDDMACEFCVGDCAEIYVLATKNYGCTHLIKCMICVKEDHCCGRYECCQGSQNSHCRDSCSDIMESVALIETALSHILNAEGEKIQKIITTTNNTNDIIRVNDAVNAMVTKITHLEHVLYSKLQLAHEICPNLCDEKSENCCKNCKR